MKTHIVQLMIFIMVFIWSAYRPHDYPTWCLEVLPAVVGVVILACTYSRFHFSKLMYWVVLTHAIILLVGGHYTYAEEPVFNYLRGVFDWSRNNYDKLGHFFQGFSPAIIASELLWGLQIVRSRGWVVFLSGCLCMAISAIYELFEWLVAEISNQQAITFLGTQGDVWDTQEDMLWCLIGCSIMLIYLYCSKQHLQQPATAKS
jgi:putative membrane protein